MEVELTFVVREYTQRSEVSVYLRSPEGLPTRCFCSEITNGQSWPHRLIYLIAKVLKGDLTDEDW